MAKKMITVAKESDICYYLEVFEQKSVVTYHSYSAAIRLSPAGQNTRPANKIDVNKLYIIAGRKNYTNNCLPICLPWSIYPGKNPRHESREDNSTSKLCYEEYEEDEEEEEEENKKSLGTFYFQQPHLPHK